VLEPGGRRRALDEDGLAAQAEAARGRLAAPFAPERLALAAGVSTRVLRAPKAGTSPAIVHFAYFTRAAALARLGAQFAERLPAGCIARPQGLVFHLPPQNVETVFLYSWLLAWLAGNANVVRVPATLGADVTALLNLFLDALAAAGDTTQLFVHYPSASDLSARLSATSDARVVWGGDAKVHAFAGMKLRDGGKAVWFGDRFSFSVAAGEALAALDDAGLRDLAEKFFNDLFVFEQMACSSPHTLYVVGDAARHRSAVQRLAGALGTAAERRMVAIPAGHAMRKLVEAFAAVGRGAAVSADWRDPHLTLVEATGTGRRDQRVGGGYLNVVFAETLLAIGSLIREHDQTLTYFGFPREQMEAFARAHALAGLSRIVPVGQALDFDVVWDGYDLLRELTRLVRIT
jgi:hypothetical protein